MRSSSCFRWLMLLTLVALGGRFSYGSGATIYISQSGGTFSSGTACNGQTTESVATFNAGTESAGNTYYLCGAITTGLTLHGSGSSGNVISMIWDTGARLSLPYGPMINLNSTSAFWLFNGGFACGPGSACDTVEAANLTGYAAGQTGIIEATQNGSALTYQNPEPAFSNCSGCHDIEIKNLIVRNLYIHSSLSDTTNNADAYDTTFGCTSSSSGCAGGTISIHDNNIHDQGNTLAIEKFSTATTVNIYNNDIYRMNWALDLSGNGPRSLNFYNNYCHDASNWDTTADAFHHNCIHSFMNTPSDSLITNIYNNVSYGEWGNCCTTATLLFVEIDAPDNLNLFNNLEIQNVNDLAPSVEYESTNGIFANNTFLGAAATSGNNAAIRLWGTTINTTFENNVIENYGQYVVVYSGATFAAFDYNTYGSFGNSGNNPWVDGSNSSTKFTAWQALCSCDAHGKQNNNLGLNSVGVPEPGSVVIGAGANLAGLGNTALDFDATGEARPSAGVGPWAAGAYNIVGPNPPTITSINEQTLP